LIFINENVRKRKHKFLLESLRKRVHAFKKKGAPFGRKGGMLFYRR